VLDVHGLTRIAVSIVLSPLMGLALGFALMVVVLWIFRDSTPSRVDAWFRRGQLLSAALYSLGHGGNDAQKTMGIIAVLLYANGFLGSEFYVPLWVVLACHAAMGLGTLTGGWRIVRTMGLRITKLKPVGGFCAETGGAVTLFAATHLGVPVSTTHTITGAIVGVGSISGASAVRWGVAGRIVWAWVLTIPCSAAIAALTCAALRRLT
jgi:PiT family inorganic phosphate transporter